MTDLSFFTRPHRPHSINVGLDREMSHSRQHAQLMIMLRRTCARRSEVVEKTEGQYCMMREGAKKRKNKKCSCAERSHSCECFACGMACCTALTAASTASCA